MNTRACFAALSGLGLLAAACTTTTTPPVGDPGGASPPSGTSSGDTPSTGGAGSSGASPGPGPGPSPSNGSWGPSRCPAKQAGGFAVGEALGELTLKDCDSGEAASLDDVCGAQATWIFAAHTHCPTCQATAGFTDEVAAEVASKDVAVVQLVYDDNGTSCAKWRDAYKLAGLSNVRVYEDPEGGAWEKLKARNVTASSTFLDARRVITFKDHSLSKADVLSRIDEALSKK